MKRFLQLAFVAALATPTFATDLMITTAKHTDATEMMGQKTPAMDSTQITWMGKDRMRTEEGSTVTIVRNDLKKMFFLDTDAKTYSFVDLPFDMKKHMPPEMAPMIEMQTSQMNMTVVATTETKKIKDWTATKYVMTMAMPMMTMTTDVWTTKDVKLDYTSFAAVQGSMMSMMPGSEKFAAEFKKLEGYPVLREVTVSIMGMDAKSKEEVTAVESKEAPEGTYDVPKDFTERPFDMMNDSPNSGMGGGRPRGGARPGGKPKGEKPAERPKVPPAPEPK
ncbi:MAG: hypothetical protein JNL28_00605 [Planctomycetes bacterium]|nr:hypothetical protein [Planctomycetota bacterium]